MTHIADNHEALLDYLYEEGDPAERLTIAQHLQECAACSVAVLEFQNVRNMLGEWSPPASELGFRVVQDPQAAPLATVEHGTQSGWWPGWAPASSRGMLQVAAAVLLFVAGMVFSQLDVNYENGRITVAAAGSEAPRKAREASIVLAANPAAPPIATDPSLPTNPTSPTNPTLPTNLTDPVATEQLLQRVRSMIDQSEQRQQRELALRLSQVTREVDTQHQADLLRIQQDFGRQQEATMDYLVRTSGGVK